MKVTVQGMNSYEAHVANTRLPESDLERQTSMYCTGRVFVKQADIRFGGEKEHYRPYLWLSGEVHSLKGSFLNDVTEMTFPKNKVYPTVDYRYEFTNQQLSELDMKGLHDDGFAVPDIFLDNYFELPMSCDVCSVKGTEAPVMFVNVNQPYNNEINMESSGYNLASYFEKTEVPEKIVEVEEEIQRDEIEDMFTDEPVTQQEQQQQETVEAEKPEIKRELTPEEKMLQTSLSHIEEYTNEKVKERQERLRAAAEHDNLAHESAEAAINELKQDVQVDLDEPDFIDDDFIEDDDDFSDVPLDDIPEETPDKGTNESVSLNKESPKTNMTFGELVEAEARKAEESKKEELADDNEDADTDDFIPEDEIEDSDEEFEDNKSDSKAKKRVARAVAQDDQKEAQRRDRRRTAERRMQAILDEAEKSDSDFEL